MPAEQKFVYTVSQKNDNDDNNLSCPFGITSLIGCEIAKAEMTHFQSHCLLVNMPFTKEDKILIKNLFELKDYNARHLVREFPRKG